MPESTPNAAELVLQIARNYFATPGRDARTGTDSAGIAWLVAHVKRLSGQARVFGLRFLDFPALPPALRFWLPNRWAEAAFVFDFTTIGDAGASPSGAISKSGVPTLCIPFHVDYYKEGWHTDRPWDPTHAVVQVGELLDNILVRT
jgi:hypothetical protein